MLTERVIFKAQEGRVRAYRETFAGSLTPVAFEHVVCIRGGDPYQEFKSILVNGFNMQRKSNTTHILPWKYPNAIINPREPYENPYCFQGLPSQEGETKGDRYLVQLWSIPLAWHHVRPRSRPFKLTAWTIKNTSPEDITPVVFLSTELSLEDSLKRKEFYYDDLHREDLLFY